jgi:hypothetical protein
MVVRAEMVAQAVPEFSVEPGLPEQAVPVALAELPARAAL